MSWADRAVPAALGRLLPYGHVRQLPLIFSLRTLESLSELLQAYVEAWREWSTAAAREPI